VEGGIRLVFMAQFLLIVTSVAGLCTSLPVENASIGLADNDERSSRRWFEAASQAAVGVFGAGLVYLQLNRLCEGTSAPDCAPSAVRLMLSAAFTGGLIG